MAREERPRASGQLHEYRPHGGRPRPSFSSPTPHSWPGPAGPPRSWPRTRPASLREKGEEGEQTEPQRGAAAARGRSTRKRKPIYLLLLETPGLKRHGVVREKSGEGGENGKRREQTWEKWGGRENDKRREHTWEKWGGRENSKRREQTWEKWGRRENGKRREQTWEKWGRRENGKRREQT